MGKGSPIRSKPRRLIASAISAWLWARMAGIRAWTCFDRDCAIWATLKGETSAVALLAGVVIWYAAGLRIPRGLSIADPVLAMPSGPAIAVLPFTNMSGDAKNDYFSDGLTEDIITELARVRELHVLARNTTFQYKGQAVEIPALGRKLGVQYVLEGGVRKSNGRVRITAQLVDANSGAHLWTERYDRQLKDIFAVQDEITSRIVGAIAAGSGGRLQESARSTFATKRPENLEAYELVLRVGPTAVYAAVVRRKNCTAGARHPTRPGLCPRPPGGCLAQARRLDLPSRHLVAAGGDPSKRDQRGSARPQRRAGSSNRRVRIPLRSSARSVRA